MGCANNALASFKWNKIRVAEIEGRIAQLDSETTVWLENTGTDELEQARRRYEQSRARLLEQLYAAKAAMLSAEARVRDVIDQMEDRQTALIITLHYIRGLSWTRVAMEIGGNNTADSVKKRAWRATKALFRE